MAVVATRWLAGENRFKYTLSSTTATNATNTSTGPCGTDIGNCVPLGGSNRHVFVFGDAWWTQSGGSKPTGFAAIQNCVAIMTGTSDMSTATMQYYAGVSDVTASPFFQDTRVDGMRFGKYPWGGIFLDDRLLMLGSLSYGGRTSSGLPPNNFGTTMCGPWFSMYYNTSDNNPRNWIHVPCGEHGFGNLSFHDSFSYTPGCNPIDFGDGYIYFYCFGTSPGIGGTSQVPAVRSAGHTGKWAVCRIDRDTVKAGDLTAPYWWDGGTGWKLDNRDPRTGGIIRRRVNVLGYSINNSDQPGGMHLRADGKIQFTNVPTGWFGAAPEVGTATVTTPGAVFSNYTRVTLIPQQGTRSFTSSSGNSPTQFDADFCYGAYSFPTITWSGKGATDQAILYSRNRWGSGAITGLLVNDTTAYWMEMFQVTGIT